jgi:hypothetical protein
LSIKSAPDKMTLLRNKFTHMRTRVLVSLAGALILAGAGCSKAPAPVAQIPVAAVPAAQEAPSTADAYLSFVRGSLASASLSAYTESDEASDVSKMKTAAMIKAATKFKFSGGSGSTRLLIVSVTNPADLAAVKAEIKAQYDTLQQLSSSARISWLAGDASHIVVVNWKSGDETLANSVVAALGGQAAAPTTAAEEKLPADTEKAAAATAVFKVDEKIMGRWKGGNRWYPGKITKVSGDEIYVNYDDGSKEVLPPMNVAHLSQPNSSIAVGQAVLAKWTDNNYYSGTVQSFDDSTVTVKWNDGSSPSKLPYSAVELPGR